MVRRVRIADPLVVFLAAIASFIGLAAVFDAGYPRAIAQGGLIPAEVKGQLIAIPFAAFAFWLASAMGASAWKRWAQGIWLVAFCALFLPYVPGLSAEVGGAHRWVKLGPLPQFQPAEFAKFAAVLYLGSILADWQPWKAKAAKDTAQWLDRNLVAWLKRLVPALLILAAAIVIEREPDLGTAGVVLGVAFAMACAGGRSAVTLAVCLGLMGLGALAMIKAEPYRKARWDSHIHRWQDGNMDDISYQTVQAEVGQAEGALVGRGMGAGRAKHVMPAATSDFIFATIGEEFGFLGSSVIILLLAAITMRLLALSRGAKDKFAGLVLVGTATWIGLQSAVNIMMANGALMPIGIPLPFISCGGSSLVGLWAALGVCNAVLSKSPVGEGAKAANRSNGRRHRRPRISGA